MIHLRFSHLHTLYEHRPVRFADGFTPEFKRMKPSASEQTSESVEQPSLDVKDEAQLRIETAKERNAEHLVASERAQAILRQQGDLTERERIADLKEKGSKIAQRIQPSDLTKKVSPHQKDSPQKEVPAVAKKEESSWSFRGIWEKLWDPLGAKKAEAQYAASLKRDRESTRQFNARMRARNRRAEQENPEEDTTNNEKADRIMAKYYKEQEAFDREAQQERDASARRADAILAEARSESIDADAARQSQQNGSDNSISFRSEKK